ncbi:ArsR family transcriptional regulator [Alteromonadaceae bacterium M269]|nr:ArsR family transcriptional regulator [Alteromonadaceae bacterium M269]
MLKIQANDSNVMDIFKALADANRRKVIEALYEEDGLSIKQLTHGSTISRQAMTKHLNILIRSKIVTAEFSGKERVHKLNPKAVKVLFDWLAPFAQQWDVRLERLAQQLGEKE